MEQRTTLSATSTRHVLNIITDKFFPLASISRKAWRINSIQSKLARYRRRKMLVARRKCASFEAVSLSRSDQKFPTLTRRHHSRSSPSFRPYSCWYKSPDTCSYHPSPSTPLQLATHMLVPQNSSHASARHLAPMIRMSCQCSARSMVQRLPSRCARAEIQVIPSSDDS